MQTPLSDVYEILDMFKSREIVFAEETIPFTFCKIGVIQASVALKKEFEVTSIVPNSTNLADYFVTGITSKETYLAGLYAYRNFAVQTHDDLKRKAINFKTISFAVSGLTERAKEVMRTVWWCNDEISKTLASMQTMSGHANEMGDTSGW